MTDAVKILLVEDNPGDVRLIRVILAEEHGDPGFSVTTADRLSTAVERLRQDNPDAVLLDLSLPDSQGLGTVVTIVAKVPGVPIIVLTGMDDEALAVSALKEGAQDYLVKNQLDSNLLSRTIRYAIERKQSEEALRANEQKFRALVEIGMDEIVVLDADLKPVYVSPSVVREMDYDPDKAESWQNPFVFIHPEDRDTAEKIQAQLLQMPGESLVFQVRLGRPDGAWRWVEGIATNLLKDASVGGLVYNFRNITDRKLRERELEATTRVEAAMRAAQNMDQMLTSLLDEALAVFNCSEGGIWLQDPSGSELRPMHNRGWGDARPPSLKRGEGIVGGVAASGRVAISRDLSQDARLHESARAHVRAGQGGIFVPIRATDQPIGVLTLNSQLPNEFNSSDEQLLVRLADIAGNAIQRMRLYEQTQNRLENIAALRAIDKAISTSFDLQFVLNVMLEQVTSRLNVDAADVLLLDPYLHVLEYGAGRGFRSQTIQLAQLRLGEEQAGRAALERRTIGIATLSEDHHPFLQARGLTQDEFVAYFAVPLISKGQVQGVLEIFHRKTLTPDSEWLSFLETLAGQAAIAIDNATLFNDLQHSNVELTLAYDATIEGWSHALDLRDKETEGHTQRVTEMAMQLARTMGIGMSDLVHMRRGGLLHDIGKMGIPDKILLKADKLTEEEWAIMMKHPAYANEMLSPIQFLRPALDIPYCHHEKWDGSGYPRGLKGEEIPLAARVFAIADVYDALTSDRPYRKAWTKEKSLEHIKAGSGSHFDPAVVEVFLRMQAGG